MMLHGRFRLAVGRVGLNLELVAGTAGSFLAGGPLGTLGA
jgi:hypothetical protein